MIKNLCQLSSIALLGLLSACTSTNQTQYITDDQGQMIVLDPFNPESVLAKNRLVFFEDNGYNVAPQYHAMLQQHGNYLSQHPKQKIRIEGHTDNQGSVEYNLGLGQRRSFAVAQILVQYGALRDQIESVSFGKLITSPEAESSALPLISSDSVDPNHYARRAEIRYLKP